MYMPSHFREERVDVLHDLIRAYPLGALVTLTPGGLNANHIPFLVDADSRPFGTLRGHVARGNPVWRDFDSRVEALVVFQGPRTYITPSWYATKRQTGKVVPTYNYMVVHAYGTLRAVEDAAWLRGLVGRLTAKFEAAMAQPWQVSDAPADFIENQLKAIVGIEIPITRLLGKWKASQNRPTTDRQGVVGGLRETNEANAAAMAEWMARAGTIVDGDTG